MSEWDERYLHAHESGSLLFPPTPTPTVVEALDHVTLASPRPSAIDVGAGEGRHSFELARRGFSVTALEGSQVAVGKARERARLVAADVRTRGGRFGRGPDRMGRRRCAPMGAELAGGSRARRLPAPGRVHGDRPYAPPVLVGRAGRLAPSGRPFASPGRSGRLRAEGSCAVVGPHRRGRVHAPLRA